MPTVTPPSLPPATPTQQQQIKNFQEQLQKQNQNQDGEFNNNFTPSSIDRSESKSISESENSVNQAGSLVNIQQNSHFDTFFKFSGGTHIPTTTLNLNASLLPEGNTIITGGINIPIGGKTHKLAKREVELATISKEASVCTGIIKAGIDISGVKNLSFCSGYKTIAVAPNRDHIPRKTQLSELKLLIQEQRKAMEDQQNTIKALQLRLIQLEHQPTTIKGTF